MKPELTFYEGLVEETALWDPLGRLFEEIDVLLCPTIATTGLQAGNSYIDEPVVDRWAGVAAPHRAR